MQHRVSTERKYSDLVTGSCKLVIPAEQVVSWRDSHGRTDRKGIPCGNELEQLHVPARPKPHPEELQGARPLNRLHDAQEEAASSAHTAVARPSERSRLQAGDTCAPVPHNAQLAEVIKANQALGHLMLLG